MSSEPLIAPQKAPASTGDKTFAGVANLIKLLPTGTVFLFQFLNPIITDDGNCQTINKYLGVILVSLCGLSCFFSSFTDSYVDKNGATHYGIATKNGLWPSSETDDVDLSAYKLKVGDFVHAFFALLVFGVVVLLNPYSVKCYYPSFESNQQTLLMVLPPVVGTISGSVFVSYPNKRHGIGYAKSLT